MPGEQTGRGGGAAAAPGPLVSVVTPCLNPGDRLERCLRSVSAQGYGAIEHVVVDGGSTDGTLERLRAAPDVRFVSEPDGGQAEAINKGFRLASGSLLTWLNADDVLLPGAVGLAVEAFGREPRLGLVFGDCRVVERGREVLTWRAPRQLTLEGLESGSSIPQPGAVVTRAALERAGGLDESFELAMDVDLWLRLLAAGVPNRHLGAVVSEFELHPGSKTVSIPRERFFEENTRAFLLAGSARGAALSAGQGAAARAGAAGSRNGAAGAGGRIDRARLEEAIACAERAALDWQPPAPARAIRAAALAEAAVSELRSGIRGLRLLLAGEIWRDGAARRRVLASVRRGAPRAVRRLVRR